MYPVQRKIVLHIGWPKTGTTTLQKHVFNKLPNYRYLGKTPFDGGRNKFTFDLVHLLAYAAQERWATGQRELFAAILEIEQELFGSVDEHVPLIISEEGILSSLLKPVDHHHHGVSTASLEQITARIRDLEIAWNVSFEVLFTEREPLEILHSYYAQAYHIFRRIRGLGTFKEYVEVGTKEALNADLGFSYLKPGTVDQRLRQQLGDHKVFRIHIDRLFAPDRINLSRWYPGFEDMHTPDLVVENSRSIAKDVKVTHLRPIWMKKERFRLGPFLRTVIEFYNERFGDHRNIEVPIVMGEQERTALRSYIETNTGS